VQLLQFVLLVDGVMRDVGVGRGVGVWNGSGPGRIPDAAGVEVQPYESEAGGRDGIVEVAGGDAAAKGSGISAS
jgi:hypothetical protein